MTALRNSSPGVTLAAFTASLMLSACSTEAPQSLGPTQSASVTVPVGPYAPGITEQEVRDAHTVAHAFALGLARPNVRAGVQKAWRDSPFTEHKLVLQEFARTRAGVALVEAAARASGVSAAELQGVIARLPEADFYLPRTEQRRAWRGTVDVVVAPAFGVNRSTVQAYRADGGEQVVTPAGNADVGALVFLAPAELKTYRLTRQRAADGDVIQDADDGSIGATLIHYTRDGRRTETPLRDPRAGGGTVTPQMVPCDPDCGGGGTTAPSDTTFLDDYAVIDVCDWGNCFEGNEFEWHTYFSTNGADPWTDRYDLRITGVPSTVERDNVNLIAAFRKPRALGQQMKSDVVEDDGSSGVDHFDPSPKWSANQNDLFQYEGAGRCGAARPYGGTYDCAVYFWHEVQQSLLWH